MEKELWDLVEACLKEMRCTNRARDTHLVFKSVEQAQQELTQFSSVYEDVKKRMSVEDKEKIEQYVDMMDHCSFEKEQRAYAQRLIDCIEIMIQIGLLKKSEFVQKTIDSMK